MKWLVQYGLYLNQNILETGKDQISNYALCYLSDGIGYDEKHVVTSNSLFITNNVKNSRIILSNSIVLHTSYGSYIKDYAVTGELKKVPLKLIDKTIYMYLTYNKKFYVLLRNFLRNTDDYDLFRVDNKVRDKSGTFIDYNYKSIDLDREYYYRLLVKYIFPFL